MYKIRNNIYFIKVFLKVSLAVIFYFILTTYTVPTYQSISAFVDEKINQQNVIIGETSLMVDIVKTPNARKNGLSNREPLLENQGMLFVFEEVDDHGIWMKDMKFSIDIIWFNEYGEVVDFEENISPDTYPEIFLPSQKSKYVLETLAGFVRREGIKLGDKIDLY